MGKKEVLVLGADQNQFESLSDLLAEHHYHPVALNSLENFENHAAEKEYRALILNLDNVSVTNKVLRKLKRKNPLLNIVALSERQFHPELEEAIREHISVCLAQPLDSGELLYWLKSIFENNDRAAT
jgi:DNA-binding NtrC family response regulator